MQKEFVASFVRTIQVSPDDWELETLNLKLTEETTIGEIVYWINTYRADKNRLIPNIKITALENMGQ